MSPTSYALSDFTQLELLGEGAYAKVYSASMEITRVEDSFSHDAVALKVLKRQHAGSPSALRDFDREKHILSILEDNLEGDHFARLIGTGKASDGRSFLVLEKLHRETLRERLPKITLWSRRLEIGLQIATALGALHSRRVMHRDLKPTNIGFGRYGAAKLFDFGLARELGSNTAPRLSPSKAAAHPPPLLAAPPPSSRSPSGAFLYDLTSQTGTVRYMAPEVALGKPYNEKSEVYSFAILLYQIIEQKLPFAGKGPSFMEHNVFTEKAWRPSLDLSLWPFGLASLVAKCWSHDLDLRPSMSEVAKALENALLTWEKCGSVEVRRKTPLDRIVEVVMGGLCCCAATPKDEERDDRNLLPQGSVV